MTPPEEPQADVFIVDDDAAVRTALSRLLRAEGWTVRTVASAEELIGHPGKAPACLVLDVSLPGLDGLGLQRLLAGSGQAPAIVFLTGHGDIPMSVEAIKAGAVDFLTKPVKAEALLGAVRTAIEQHAAARRLRGETADLQRRLAGLTPREREVFKALVAGKLNKQAAADLGIVEQTVKFHRARIMERMQAGSFAELILIASRLGLGPDEH
jgi:FixJ family two-component response regulator